MTETLTGVADATTASTEPTVQDSAVTQPAESQNQETNSGTKPQESVSDDTAKQTETNNEQKPGGESTTDDSLAKFAKGQGFDFETASEDVKRALKIAHDNQKAFRTRDTGKALVTATDPLAGGDLAAEVNQMKYERTTEKFFAGEGKDASLEPVMVEIVKEKAAELTPIMGEDAARLYAFTLSRDLDTLYAMAQLKKGGSTAPVDVEAIRREERESINKQLSAGTADAHASQTETQPKQTVTREWIVNTYDPRNPEHIKIMQEAGLR